MIKKLTTFLTIILASVGIAGAADGVWHQYPVYNDAVDNIIDTGSKIYYRSGANLYSYDNSTNEAYAYTQLNKLNDVSIKEIYYNYSKKYLLVAYENGNIDLIYDDGRIINLPEVKNATLTGFTKSITQAAFSGDLIYIATPFGLVVYNDKKYEVVETGIFNKAVDFVSVSDEYLYMCIENTLYFSPHSSKHNTLDKFTSFALGTFWAQKMFVLSDQCIVTQHTTGQIYTFNVDLAQPRMSVKESFADLVPIATFQPFGDGCYTVTADAIVTVDKQGTLTTTPLPQELKGQRLAINGNATQFWGGDQDGIAKYDISSGNVEVLSSKFIDSNAVTTQSAVHMRWSLDGNRLYVTNLVGSVLRTSEIGENDPVFQTTNIIENGRPRDVSLRGAQMDVARDQNYQQQYGNTRMYGGSNQVVEHPNDPTMHLVGTNWEGIFIVKDGAQIGKITTANCDFRRQRVHSVEFDPEGNLWVGFLTGHRYTVLPKEKATPEGLQSITIDDWVSPKIAEIYEGGTGKDMFTYFCKHPKNKGIYFTFDYGTTFDGSFTAYKTTGGYTDFDRTTLKSMMSLTDQDSKSIPECRIAYMIEDANGELWIATSSGVLKISNPNDIFASDNYVVNRVKVPRNDGTNFADYLLDGEMVFWIAVDHSNRKWIATESSGVYLVSADGDEIIEVFDNTNSPMPTNKVYCVECDPHSNVVYIGTPNGVFSYTSDSSPAADDYSEILAYPNPVRPEYSGWVTITGLMDNSLVKIADAAGNVLFSTLSEGGMVRWDCCNSSGQRVKSGVYYVFASDSAANGSSGAVAKIVVIN